MMFYDAIGGPAYVGTPNRYQGFIDMSRLLAGNDAILLARLREPSASSWGEINRPDDPNADRRGVGLRPLAQKQQHWTYYRFIIPLEEPTTDAPTEERPEPEPLIGPQPFGR
jgi:hypothetical protein